jgi:cyclopropane-fatty-acyl-phospholipid synthase
MAGGSPTPPPTSVPVRGHPLLDILDACISDARIRVRTEGGDRVIGARDAPVDDVVLRIRDSRCFDRILGARNLGIAESYMDRDFEVESGTLEEFLVILLRNRVDRKIAIRPGLLLHMFWLQVRNRLRTKRENAQKHYDLGLDLYESFLDGSMAYSCGYARSPVDSLEVLQQNKYERICRKLRLQSGDSLVDIGCGFGGLMRHAARHFGVCAVGITNSGLHWAHGNELTRKAGLDGLVSIRLEDFRELRGRFTKLCSVGMFEHVPRNEYRQYFKKVADVLEPDGMGLIQTIGFGGRKYRRDPFIQQYLFPGSRQPRLSELSRCLERNGLMILDVENLVRHYALTARRWRENFHINQGRLDPERYDDRFRRMWDYYLTCGIAAATASDSAVYQVLFARDYTTPIPLQRI